MTDSLNTKTCTPCQGGIPPLTPEEANHYLAQTE
ncbi:MAG TPA: pterin-4-alpha-carbinolamine dehydratase, partial [Alphaproteobacteria bacterium]|nr:pterin-4-alpha-carbinolamine dehydratase [Alphaproteobacteria bacterium]